MPLGPNIRRMFGRHERHIASLYRRLFIDLNDLSVNIRKWVPQPKRILEVGCGEGAVTEILSRAFPEAEILAIDVTERAGRLYSGREKGVCFRVATVQQTAQERPSQFDLIILSDVLHHVPLDLREEIIDSIGRAMAPSARFFLKDWRKAATPIHWLCHMGDRWLTGDKVSHLTVCEAKSLITRRLPTLQLVAEGYIRPWRNNYAMVFAA